ncbi:hypothetical protein BsWGS_23635 [Bradybaena similaris]
MSVLAGPWQRKRLPIHVVAGPWQRKRLPITVVAGPLQNIALLKHVHNQVSFNVLSPTSVLVDPSNLYTISSVRIQSYKNHTSMPSHLNCIVTQLARLFQKCV